MLNTILNTCHLESWRKNSSALTGFGRGPALSPLTQFPIFQEPRSKQNRWWRASPFPRRGLGSGQAAPTYLWNRPAESPGGGPRRWRTAQHISSCSIWRASSAWRPSWRRYSGAAGGAAACKRSLRSEGSPGKSCWRGACSPRRSWRESACREKGESQAPRGRPRRPARGFRCHSALRGSSVNLVNHPTLSWTEGTPFLWWWHKLIPQTDIILCFHTHV